MEKIKVRRICRNCEGTGIILIKHISLLNKPKFPTGECYFCNGTGKTKEIVEIEKIKE